MNAHQRRVQRRLEAWKKDVINGWKARDGPHKKLVAPVAVGVKAYTIVPANENVPEAKTVGVKTGRFASAANFERALEKRGFKKLGSGAYSSVYAKDGYDRVIKVTRYLDNWIDYVAWASKNGYAGSFAPRVYSWKRFGFDPEKPKKQQSMFYWERHSNGWSVAVVERMKETLNADSQLAKDFKIIERIHDLAERSVLAELVMDEIIPGVGNFFKKLHRAFRANDVYGKNLMIRKDGTFCVTDPVCGDIVTTETRFKAGDFSPVVRYY